MIAFSVNFLEAGREVTFKVTNDTKETVIYILVSLHSELIEGYGPISPSFEFGGRLMSAAKIIAPGEVLEYRLVYGKGKAKVEHYFGSQLIATTDFSEGVFV